MNADVVHIRAKTIQPLKIRDKIFKSAYDWELTEEDLRKAASELGETEERKKKCLQKLKEKLSSDSDFKYRQDDAYLLRYLRVRKYDVKKAYQNIKTFFEQRKKHRYVFTIPQDLKSVQELNWYSFLPYADEEGRIITILNFNRWNPEERTLEEMIRAAANIRDIVSMNPKCQVNGIVALWNFEGFSTRYLTNILSDGRLGALISFAQSGYPLRIKKMVLLNTNRFIRLLYNMVRPLLQKKLTDRCILLGSDLNELHQHINPALLPKRLKGMLEEEECDTSQHILDNLAYIKYERSFTFG